MRRHAHRPAWVVLCALVWGAVVMVVPTRADATSTSLCRGFVQCTERGYPNRGYREARAEAHWNMTSGVNCTNYVAYRMTHGRLVARPPGTAAARTWAEAARAAGVPVLTEPRVGDVAWWDANDGLSGRKGHVAVVERVRVDGSIVVSEDNTDEAFGWRVVRRGSHFPRGFIRYPESDGSPYGALTSLSAKDGRLTVKGSGSEPDRPGALVTYLVTVGAPRERAPQETFTFSTAFFVFSWIKTVRSRGTVPVWIYGLNTAGTPGKDALLGRATVTIR